MAFEWLLKTPVTKTFVTINKVISTRAEPGVGEDGEPTLLDIEEETEHVVEVDAPADRVRLRSAGNDTSAMQFHIRLLYGRQNDRGEFESSIRDDGIIVGGPEYATLDTNQDGLISEDELLNMSAKILGWDGELKELSSLWVEGQAS